MSTIHESNLPGVGRKFQVHASSGDRLTIIIHDDGRRELYHFTRENPQRVASVVILQDDEARQVAGIIGGLTYAPRALPTTEMNLGDLVLDWYTMPENAAAVGRTIGELGVRRVTDASIVSLIRSDGGKQINPGADTVLTRGATLVVAGDRKSIEALKRLLVSGRID
ncbi:MAG TPA: cation:proton antiporter regulatory subunit [Caldilineaceae bacterium]|nr:cation:proton antiporter regulatory subunit [Caldilineaceae bacterium]